MPPLKGIKYLTLSKKLIDRRTWVMYLIIPDMVKFGDKVMVQPDDNFYKTVDEHMEAYVNKGVMPPADIASAILNMSDDYLAGREITIRAGDYIAIQNHMRTK
jgi:hypothetical protein